MLTFISTMKYNAGKIITFILLSQISCIFLIRCALAEGGLACLTYQQEPSHCSSPTSRVPRACFSSWASSRGRSERGGGVNSRSEASADDNGQMCP